MKRHRWMVSARWMAVLLAIALVGGYAVAQVADPEGDADVPCVDLVSVDVTSTTSALKVTAQMSSRPYPDQYVIDGIDDPNEIRLCPAGLYEVQLDVDRDGTVDRRLRLYFDRHGEATVAGPDSLRVDYSIRHGEVSWHVDLADLDLAERPATIGLRVEARILNDGSVQPLVDVDTADEFPDGWQDVIVGAAASRLVGPTGGTITVPDEQSPLLGLTMEIRPRSLDRVASVGFDIAEDSDLPEPSDTLQPTCYPPFSVVSPGVHWVRPPLMATASGPECSPQHMMAFHADEDRWTVTRFVDIDAAGRVRFEAAVSRPEESLWSDILNPVMSFFHREAEGHIPCGAERSLYVALKFAMPHGSTPDEDRELRNTLVDQHITRVLINVGSAYVPHKPPPPEDQQHKFGCMNWLGLDGNEDSVDIPCHDAAKYEMIRDDLASFMEKLPPGVQADLWINMFIKEVHGGGDFVAMIETLRDDIEGLLGVLLPDLPYGVHLDIEPLSESRTVPDGRTYMEVVLQDLVDPLHQKFPSVQFSLFGSTAWSEENLQKAIKHARVYYGLYDAARPSSPQYTDFERNCLEHAEEALKKNERTKLVPVVSSSDNKTDSHDPRIETVDAATKAIRETSHVEQLGGLCLFMHAPGSEHGKPTPAEWNAFASVLDDCPALFRDDFDNGLDAWDLVGSPPPRWISSLHDREGVFDNNGDSWCASQGLTRERFQLEPPFTLKGEVYMDTWNIAGCWQKATIGLSHQPLTTGLCAGQEWRYDAYVAIDFDGDACWGTPSQFRRHAWAFGGYFGNDGQWHCVNMFSFQADRYLGRWVELRMVVDKEGIPAFYIDDELLCQGTVPIDMETLQNARIILGNRSSGSAGKAYHDWVELTPVAELP